MKPSELALVRCAADAFDVSVEDVIGRHRGARVVAARRAVLKVLHERGHSYAAAARVVGLHWKTASRASMPSCPYFDERVERMRKAGI